VHLIQFWVQLYSYFMYHVNPLITSVQPSPVHVVYSGIKVSFESL